MVFALPDDIRSFIKVSYATDEKIKEALEKVSNFANILSNSHEHSQGDRLAHSFTNSQEVIDYVDTILHHAIRSHASDIHIEPEMGTALGRVTLLQPFIPGVCFHATTDTGSTQH